MIALEASSEEKAISGKLSIGMEKDVTFLLISSILTVRSLLKLLLETRVYWMLPILIP